MQILITIGILIVSSFLAAALAPKPPKQKAALLEEFDVPTAEEGREIPDVFGTVLIRDPNVLWYGDLGVKKVTV